MRFLAQVAGVFGFLIFLSGGVLADPFVMPAEGPVPFRRDRIIIEPQAMREMARTLMVVGQGLHPDSAEKRRAMAQIFALSEALDPQSRTVGRLREEILERKFRPSMNVDALEGRLKWLWEAVEWLERPDAGIDGQSLAGCLKDILQVVDSVHPRVPELRQIGEHAAWNGWVAPVSAYRMDPEQDIKPDEPENDRPSDPKPVATPTQIRLEQASLPVILWKPVGPEGRTYPQASREELMMKAYIQGRPDPDDENAVEYQSFHVSIGAWGDSDALHGVSRQVENLLRNRYDDLPEGLRIDLRNPEMETSLNLGQRHAMSAVSSVLATMALKGTQHEGLILGAMDEGGNFRAATDIRALITSLKDAQGLRLIVPEDAEDSLLAFLAMESADFFIKNEVFSARTLDDVLELSASQPEGSLQSAREKFFEIRDKQGVQDIRTYVANSFIRQRLASVYEEEARHLSAKLLLLQASGKRPVYLTREVLASDLRTGLMPMVWIFQREYMGPSDAGLGDLYDVCQKSTETVIRYAARDDKDVVDRATQVLDAIRKLDRTIRTSRGEYWEKERDIREDKRQLEKSARDFKEFVDELLKAKRGGA